MNRYKGPYSIMTLNAEKVLNTHMDCIRKAENGHYQIFYKADFAKNRLHKQEMLSSTEKRNENALFAQIYFLKRDTLCKKGLSENSSSWDENFLKDSIFYMDFSSVFRTRSKWKNSEAPLKRGKNTYSKKDLEKERLSLDIKLYFLFKNGVEITFVKENGEVYSKNFLPFDKSGSMSRNCGITFIDSDIKKGLDERLLLGMDFTSEKSKVKVIPSKYFAYRGLYLTDAKRIEPDDRLVWDEERIIVVKDENHTFRNGKAVSQLTGIRNQDNISPFWEQSLIKGTVLLNAFDGEGLISPMYAKLINEQLESRKGSTSFQIRMPFIKGVLHTVDFHAFLEEYLPTSDTYIIEDVFGRKRDLKKAEIILTESMLKNVKWLKEQFSGEETDPMGYLFQKFEEYHHTLYIANTDKNYDNSSKKTKLNYQFLNTLDMDRESFSELIKEHLSMIHQIEKDKTVQRKLLLGKIADGNLEYEEGEETADGVQMESWKYALSKNIDFLKEPVIRNRLKSIKESFVFDIYSGNLLVEGECRLFSCDLLSLLICILKGISSMEGVAEQEKTTISDIIARLKKECIATDRFYLSKPSISLDPSRAYAVLRNPHLSRNEQCLLRPYIPKSGTVFDKYFSNLPGVIMVAYESLVPMILSGADFDGDLVKVIANKQLVQAIRKGAYERNLQERKLPVVKIPSEHTDPGRAPDVIGYQEVKDTFGNQIGRISNMAIRFGKYEYGQKAGEESSLEEECTEEQEQYAAYCTLLTGLEIDAAKTGVHPNKNIEDFSLKLRQLLKEKSDEKDYYIDRKKQFDILRTFGNYRNDKETKKALNSDSEKYILYYGKNKKVEIEKNQDREDTPNIDRLPAYFFEAMVLKEKKAVDGEIEEREEGNTGKRFTFQGGTWKKNLDTVVLEKVKLLSGAYKEIIRLNQNRNKYIQRCKNSKWAGKVYTTIELQYDFSKNRKEDMMETLDWAYRFLQENFLCEEETVLDDYEVSEIGMDFEKLNHSIELSEMKKWHLTKPENRKEVLEEILQMEKDAIPEDIMKLFVNFNNSGYMFLYYILQDIKCSQIEAVGMEDIPDANDADQNIVSSSYYMDMKKILEESIREKENTKLLKYHLRNYFRDVLSRIFEKKIKEAVPFVYALAGENSLFWDIFETDEVMEYIIE